MRSITVKAFAKLNLGLRILGRRADGFHELRTIYQTISLCDLLDVSLGGRRAAGPVVLAVEGLEVPAGQENVAARAATRMVRELGLRQQVRIRLRKRIPAGGGLGGGSSDAAAVLRALDELTGKRMDRGTLLQVAASLGSDVPFFLFGGRAVGVGRGEEVYPLPDAISWRCLVAVPSEGMNTAEAYRLLNAKPWPPSDGAAKDRSHSESLEPQPTADTFMASLLRESHRSKVNQIAAIGNDFEAMVLKRFPALAEAKQTMLRCGADWAALTGSGSAIFGLFRQRAKVEQAHAGLQSSGLKIFPGRTISRREHLAACKAR
jgi:4-diphosphocytidyl-2-C-methyl-D-erythritol kinase